MDKKENVINSTKVTLYDIEPNESKAFYAIMSWPKSAKKYEMDVDEVKVDWRSSYGYTGEK